MESKLIKEIQLLKIYTVLLTVIFLVLVMSSFVTNSNQKFDQIDVERINIVESDGQLKMVISNKARQHPGIVNG